MYASFLRILRALHLDVFEQPEANYFFNNLLMDGRFNGSRNAENSKSVGDPDESED